MPADDVGGRTRQGPRPVHPRHPHRRRCSRRRSWRSPPPNTAPPRVRLGERSPTPERLGRAFTELIHRYPTKNLPKAGGVNATVVVTMTLDSLLGGLKAAQPRHRRDHLRLPGRASWPVRPGSSPPSSAGSPRSSTSAATGASTPEPNGSPRPSNRRGCTAEGCDWPPGLCHLHHPIPWAAAAAPTTTASCSAPATTPAPTTPPTPWPSSPAGRSPSPGAPEPTGPDRRTDRVRPGAQWRPACTPCPPDASQRSRSQNPRGNPIASPPLALAGAVNPTRPTHQQAPGFDAARPAEFHRPVALVGGSSWVPSMRWSRQARPAEVRRCLRCGGLDRLDRRRSS